MKDGCDTRDMDSIRYESVDWKDRTGLFCIYVFYSRYVDIAFILSSHSLHSLPLQSFLKLQTLNLEI